MNYIKAKKIADLYDTLNYSIYLSGDINQIRKEASYNGWGIMLDDELAKTIDVETLVQFIREVIKYRTEEIATIKTPIKVTLYFWFDEFISRLCFNILSGEDRELPFVCKINIIDSPYSILKKFIKKSYDYALHGNLHEIQFFEKGDPEFDEDYEVDLDQVTIDAWKITLPFNGEIEL